MKKVLTLIAIVLFAFNSSAQETTTKEKTKSETKSKADTKKSDKKVVKAEGKKCCSKK
jgi:hypothetical protein